MAAVGVGERKKIKVGFSSLYARRELNLHVYIYIYI